MKAFLVDFGSTSVKYAVYDRESDTVSSEGKLDFPPRIPNDNPNITEIDLTLIDGIIDRAVEIAAENACKDIYISVQMHGYILGSKSGFSNYVSWQDKRALDGRFERFDKEGIDYTALGTTYKVNSPLVSLYGENLEGKEYYTLGSYIAYRMTGNNATHITDSAASGFYYADSAELANPKCYPMAFARSTNKIEVVGTCRGMNVYAPVGDHQVTFLGLGIDKGGTLLNISTATQISTVSNQLSENYECRPFFANGRLCTVSGLIGGMVIRQREIPGDTYSDKFAQELAQNYGAALSCMPESAGLVIGGGATVHFRALIEAVGDKIGVPYRITDELSAFKGLIRVVKGDF